MSRGGFIKLMGSEETEKLMDLFPNAFLLLTLIAYRAKRTTCVVEGLEIGEAFVGDHQKCGLTRQQYRTALKVLVDKKFIYISETSRNRKKSTNGSTTWGTKVKLLNSTIWDINVSDANHPINQRPTNDQPTTNHKQEVKKERSKENHPPLPPSSVLQNPDERRDDSFSKSKTKKKPTIEIYPGIVMPIEDWEKCVELKRGEDAARDTIIKIWNDPKCSKLVKNWPETILTWKFLSSSVDNFKKNQARGKQLEQVYDTYKKGHGYRCLVTRDYLKDQFGLYFEYESPYVEGTFVSFSNPDFDATVDAFMSSKMIQLSKAYKNTEKKPIEEVMTS